MPLEEIAKWNAEIRARTIHGNVCPDESNYQTEESQCEMTRWGAEDKTRTEEIGQMQNAAREKTIKGNDWYCDNIKWEICWWCAICNRCWRWHKSWNTQSLPRRMGPRYKGQGTKVFHRTNKKQNRQSWTHVEQHHLQGSIGSVHKEPCCIWIPKRIQKFSAALH